MSLDDDLTAEIGRQLSHKGVLSGNARHDHKVGEEFHVACGGVFWFVLF